MVGERRRLGRRRARARAAVRLGVPLVLATVVVVLGSDAVAQIGRQSGPYRRTVDRGYAALALPVTQQSNSTAASLRTFIGDAPSLNRPTFFADLDSMAAQSAQTWRQFEALTPPVPAGGDAPCRAAMSDRAGAVESLRASLESVVGGRNGLAPVDEAAATAAVQDAGRTIASADVAWATCRRQLRRAPGNARLAASVWATDRRVFTPDALARLVPAVTTARGLIPDHRLSVLAVITEPQAVPSGQTRVAPPTTTLAAQVVVANQGNVDEDGVEVGGVVFAQNQPASPVPVQATADIPAGGSATLSLPHFGVLPGTMYQLQVTAETPSGAGPGTGVIATRSITVQVQQATTVVTVTSLPLVPSPARPVALSAAIAPGLDGVGTPTGTVNFSDNGATIDGCQAQPVRTGVATCTTTLPASSTNAIGATYSGDARFAGSVSALITLAVGGR